MIEIEVKAHVDNPRKMERAIISMGATPIGIRDQADTYYNAPHRNFERNYRLRSFHLDVSGNEHTQFIEIRQVYIMNGKS